jgi:hypothetical protein
MGVEVVGAIATLLGSITGLAVYLLSRRAQKMGVRRQESIDQGPFIEQQRLWQSEIVTWYKERIREMERECEEEIRAARIQYSQALVEADRRADYWKERAEAYRRGNEPNNDTPPPDRRDQHG